MAGAIVVAGVLLAGALRTGTEVRSEIPIEGVFAEAPFREEVRELAFGTTLGQLLREAGLESNDHHEFLLAFREHGSPQRLRAGADVIFRRQGEEERIDQVQVELDADRRVVLRRDQAGRWQAGLEVLPTMVDTVYAVGEIATSLWNAIMDSPELDAVPRGDRRNFIDDLDRVFQWEVDFHREIQPGDSFRFVVERVKRPDGSMKSGQLLAAELVNDGDPHHAIWFDPNGDGEGSWYNLEGESVRKAFLLRPLKFSRISSRFTMSRFHPILRRWRAHRGVDYAADAGTPIEATADGVVTRRGWNESYGRVIDLRHGNGILTRYAHMQGFAQGTEVGSRIRQGQVIGYVGMTGMATGPHLHYEMHTRAGPVDPLSVDLPPAEPVPAEALAQWELIRDAHLTLLMRLPGADLLNFRYADQQ